MEWETVALSIAKHELESWKGLGPVKAVLEHESESTAKGYLEYLMMFLKKEIIQRLAAKNDMIGNAEPKMIYNIYTSPSSIRYVRHSYDLVKHCLDKNLNDVTIVEIGGGYGGMALITLEMASLLGLTIKNYVIYDLPGVGELQRFYLNKHGVADRVQWNDCMSFGSDLDPSEKNVLFSSYSLSSLHPEYRDSYLRTILPVLKGGLLIWNGNHTTRSLLPSPRYEIPEVPNTNAGGLNTIIRW